MNARKKWAADYQQEVIKYNEKFNQQLLTQIVQADTGLPVIIVDPELADFFNNQKLTNDVDLVHDNKRNAFVIHPNEELVKSPQYQKAFDLAVLYNNIERLKAGNQELLVRVDDNVTNRLTNLYNALKDAPANSSNQTVIRHFQDVTANLIKNPKPAPESVEKDIENLQASLKGKPPLSAKIVSAIAGFVGAVLGFGIGLTIGAIVTHGIGAIPAGIAAAFQGFTLGTKLGITGAAMGAAAGGSFGFFKGKENEVKDGKNQLYAINQTKIEIDSANESLRANARLR